MCSFSDSVTSFLSVSNNASTVMQKNVEDFSPPGKINEFKGLSDSLISSILFSKSSTWFLDTLRFPFFDLNQENTNQHLNQTSRSEFS